MNVTEIFEMAEGLRAEAARTGNPDVAKRMIRDAVAYEKQAVAYQNLDKNISEMEQQIIALEIAMKDETLPVKDRIAARVTHEFASEQLGLLRAQRD